MDQNWLTRNTLIQGALDKDDDTVWAELTTYYLPFIRYVLQHINIPQTDIDDVAQEVLITLWQKLDLYTKEKGKFRTWLGTVIRNTAYNHIAQKKSEQQKHEALCNEESSKIRRFSEPELQKIIDDEWKSHLSSLALKRLGDSFGENAIQCFLDGMHSIPATETAERLGLSVETVYSSRKRVKARLLREIQHLRQQLEF
jgi:RNA polymerase sigma-70 factor (ECF subfamily)